MKRMHSDILAFAGVFLLLAAYLASALPALPAGTRPSSVLLAAAVLLSCSGILYFIPFRFMSFSMFSVLTGYYTQP